MTERKREREREKAWIAGEGRLANSTIQIANTAKANIKKTRSKHITNN